MRQSADLVINPITVDNFAALFNGTPVDRASNSMIAPDLKLCILNGSDRISFVCTWSTGAQLMISFIFRFPVVLFGTPNVTQDVVSVESSSLLPHSIYFFTGMIH